VPENPQLLAGRPLRSCGRVCTVFAKPAANRSCHHVPQAIEPWLSDQPPANSAHPDTLHLLHAPPRKHINGHGRDRYSTGLAPRASPLVLCTDTHFFVTVIVHLSLIYIHTLYIEGRQHGRGKVQVSVASGTVSQAGQHGQPVPSAVRSAPTAFGVCANQLDSSK
jgi:hypothetical protein